MGCLVVVADPFALGCGWLARWLEMMREPSPDALCCCPFLIQKPDSLADAIEAFKEFLTRSESTFMFDALDEEDEWSMFTELDFQVPLTTIAKSLCENVPELIGEFVKLFEPMLKKVYDTQRAVGAAMYAEFINQRCGGELSLVNQLKNGLLSKLVDPSHVVRMMCIRGLGNVASIPDEEMKQHITTVLSAMMAGMDDRDDPHDAITLEAMNGLSKVLSRVAEDSVRAILINISLRIRPCFEKDKVFRGNFDVFCVSSPSLKSQ